MSTSNVWINSIVQSIVNPILSSIGSAKTASTRSVGSDNNKNGIKYGKENDNYDKDDKNNYDKDNKNYSEKYDKHDDKYKDKDKYDHKDKPDHDHKNDCDDKPGHDKQPVTLHIGDATATEGDALVFDLTLSAPTNKTIVFRLNTASGSASEGPDFDSIDGTFVTFAPNQTLKTVTVSSNEDDLAEGAEVFTLSASVVSDGKGDKDDHKDHDKDKDKDKDDDKDDDKDYGWDKDDKGKGKEYGKDKDKDDDKHHDKHKDKDDDKHHDKHKDKDDDKGHGKDDHGHDAVKVVVANHGNGTILDDTQDVVALHIEKSAAVPGGTANVAGETITYTYLVTNAGNVAVADVVVTDDNATPGSLGDDFNPTFVGGDANNNGLLDVGETWSYSATLSVTQDHLDDGDDIVNVATAAGTGADTVSDDATVDVVRNPALQIVKTADAQQAADEAGESLTYTITVTNDGNVSLTGVAVTDPFADSVNAVLDNGFNIGDLDEDNVLDVGEIWTYTATHIVTQAELDEGGNLVNVATADSNESPPDSDDASVPVEQDKALDIEKSATVGDGTADEVGDVVTYTYTVTNTGNAAIANVVVVDDNATPSNAADDVTLTLQSGDVDTDGLLDVGETWTYSATHVVTQAELDAGSDIVNIATATGTGATAASDDATVPVVQDRALNIVKSAAIGDGTADEVGDVITYTYTVTNVGNAAIANVVVVDDNATPSNAADDVTLILQSGDADTDGLLDVGETWSYSETHIITQAELDAGDDIVNVATATGTGADAASDDATVEIEQNHSLNVMKSAAIQDGGEAVDEVGDVIIYTYTVTNTGNAAISGVTVVDDNATPSDTSDDVTLTLDSGDLDTDGLLDVGETWTYTSTYTVTAQDFESGTSLVNLVTVTSDDAPPDSDTETVPLDGLPEGGEASATVSEAGNEATANFAVGTVEFATPGSDIENASDDLGLSFGPDGPAVSNPFTWSTTVSAVDDADGDTSVSFTGLTSGGFPVVWNVSPDGLTLTATANGITVATLTAEIQPDNSVTYSYQQIGPFDHPEAGQSGANDTIQLGFSYTITDGTPGAPNGNTDTGSLTVTVQDDEPMGVGGAGELVPDAQLVKVESVQSGATGTNMAFVVDVSDSTTQTVPGGGTRLSVEIDAIKAVLQQAMDANVLGPVLLVAFHGNWTGGSNVEPRTFFETYASAEDAWNAVDGFFAALGGPPFGAGVTPPQPGSTRWEGGLDAAADWFANPSALVENLPEDDHISVNPIIPPNNVALSDNRIFLLTDGGNNNAAGGFTPTAGDVANLYTNVGSLANDIPNLTIRTVAILNGDTDGDGTADAVEYASVVDQSDDNLVNGSATIIDDEAGITGIVGGFGTLVSNTTAAGNLFEDDDLIGGPGADGVTPIIGADGFQGMVSFTYQSGPNPSDTTTITSSDTVTTFLGGTIEVDFETGDYFYSAPTSSVSGTDHFTYVLLDGDDDPLNGVLDIQVGLGGTTADNAGFETDTLIFWSAAGAAWVEEDSKYSVNDALTEGSHVGVIHTGNSLAAETNNTEITPDSDRTLYNNADLVGFIGQPGLTTLNNAGGIPGANGTVLNGSVLKGTFNVANPGSVDVSFDWQFLTDHGINSATSENDIAFVVIEGQLFVLANSDNLGTRLDNVLAAQNVTIDSQTFTNATAFNDDETILNVTDAGGDGIIHIAFGVVNAGATANSASALIIDDVQITPHV